jgi:hypothetical protein
MKRELAVLLFGLAVSGILPISSHAGYMEEGTNRPGSDMDHGRPDHSRHVRAEGEWQTDFGMMSLDRSGTMVEGNYEHNSGKISGSMERNILRGFWFQDRADTRCERPKNGTHYWGRLKFVFTGRTFTGSWGYCEDRPTADWNGHRAR